MARNLLTDYSIKSAKPRDQEFYLNDGDGLALRVRPNGKREWFYRFKQPGANNLTKVSLGTYPDRSLAGAREEADRLRRERAAGHEPTNERVTQQTENRECDPVLQELFLEWEKTHGPTIDSAWLATRRSQWLCHIRPVLGDRKASSVLPGEVIKIYDALTAEGKEVTGRRTVALVKQIMHWATQRNLVGSTPLLDLVPPRKKRVIRQEQRPDGFTIDQYLSAHGEESVGSETEDDRAGRALRFEELAELFGCLMPASGQADSGKRLVKFMLATGVRSAEAVRLRWSWINMDKRLLIIPAGSMKKARMHHVHLSDFALAQLRGQWEAKTGDFVFQAPKKAGSHILRSNVGADIAMRQFYEVPGESEQLYEARKAKRLKARRATREYDLYNLPGGKWTLYDMRRTVATRLQELGVGEKVVGLILAHAKPTEDMTSLYARHGYWEERCRALDKLGDRLLLCELGEST